MSCSPQNPSPTSPLSPSWPMFSAPSSPMPTSSTSSDSSPIRSVAEFALLFVAFAIFCLIYSVSPTSLSFSLCIPCKSPHCSYLHSARAELSKVSCPRADPLNPPLSPPSGARRRWQVTLAVLGVAGGFCGFAQPVQLLRLALLLPATGKACAAFPAAARNNKPLSNAVIPHFLTTSFSYLESEEGKEHGAAQTFACWVPVSQVLGHRWRESVLNVTDRLSEDVQWDAGAAG